MPRKRSNKEYAIRLTHPKLGIFYFNYENTQYYNYNHNDTKLVFTQNLKKVRTWKTLNAVNENISNIKDRLDNNKNDKIILPISNEKAEEIISINDAQLPSSHLILSRKNYYYSISSIISKTHLDLAKSEIDNLDITMVNGSEEITKLIKKSNFFKNDFTALFEKMKNGDFTEVTKLLNNSQNFEKKFTQLFGKLKNDINKYQKNYMYFEKNKNNVGVTLDIADASYGFRLLKLKTLAKIEIE